MMDFDSTPATILCCLCGVAIQANPSNMCVNCVRTQVDITDGIPKNLNIQFCKGCGRYLNPPNQWVTCDMESKELLALCLKRVKGLNKVKLVDAGFIWTEPHSRRIKVKLTIQKEVFTSTILQQVFVIEFVVCSQQCEACQRKDAKDTWQAVVQARQKVDHKKTFFFLEQLIIKHNAHLNTINIKERPDGIDFFFSSKSHAAKMTDFLQAVAPLRYKTAEKLISEDKKNNTANVKYTFSVEIVPICRDDVVCIPYKTAQSFGNISPLLLCVKVSGMIYLMDPLTLQTAEMQSATFWNAPFRAIASAKQLVEYSILDVTLLGPTNGKFALADVQVTKVSDFGKNDTILYTRTHLGRLFNPGDTAFGYDLANSIYNDADTASLRGRDIPDVILVRKSYPERRKKHKPRHWQIQTLTKEAEDMKPAQMEKLERDHEEFLRDLEEDPDYRGMVNLVPADNAEAVYTANQNDDEMDGEDFPEVQLSELVSNMNIEEEDDRYDE